MDQTNFFLRNFMFEVGVIDLGFSENIFTWCNKRGDADNDGKFSELFTTENVVDCPIWNDLISHVVTIVDNDAIMALPSSLEI